MDTIKSSHLRDFEEQGFCVIPDVLSPRLLEVAKDLLAAHRESHTGLGAQIRTFERTKINELLGDIRIT
jgi:hypothetical protein